LARVRDKEREVVFMIFGEYQLHNCVWSLPNDLSKQINHNRVGSFHNKSGEGETWVPLCGVGEGKEEGGKMERPEGEEGKQAGMD
jgi:hypothetical protein